MQVKKKKYDSEEYHIKHKYKNIDIIEYSEYFLVNNRKFKTLEKAQDYIEDILGITYQKKHKNPMKKRDSYNIYRGYTIKYIPLDETYKAYNDRGEVIARGMSLREVKQNIDSHKEQFNIDFPNPMKNKRKSNKKNPAIDPAKYFAANPLHFPKKKSGRPRKPGRPKNTKATKIFGKGRKPKIKWWLVSLYRADGNLIKVLAGQGTKANVMLEAEKLSKGRGVHRAELQGPYRSMPSVSTSKH